MLGFELWFGAKQLHWQWLDYELFRLPLWFAVPLTAAVSDYIEDICHLRYLRLHARDKKPAPPHESPIRQHTQTLLKGCSTMALYAFDGTGNEDKADDEKGGFDSNVLHLHRGYEDPLKNDDEKKERGSLYLKGIGTRAHTFVGDKVAEAFGFGGHRRVRQMMTRLEHNFEAGDFDIDVIGFSRGAALAISFANEVASKLPKLTIRFIGVWDIVGEFGVAGEHLNAGHNLNMPPNVEHCYHAMALDERRAFFQLTRLSGTGEHALRPPVEVWFRGVHSDVGGGNGNVA